MGWAVSSNALNYGVMSTATEPDTVASLGEEFPDWHVWRGRSGGRLKGWYATRDRRQKLSSADQAAGLFRTLGADNSQGLREQLEQQQSIENRGRAVR